MTNKIGKMDKRVIIQQTVLARLRANDLEKAYAKNPNPTTLREYKAAVFSRDKWDKLYHDEVGLFTIIND